MAKHNVICPYCKQTFDTNSTEFVQINRRYAHKECYEKANGGSPFKKDVAKEKKDQDPDLLTLKNYIKELYKEQANWPLITKQIKKFHNELNFSYSGILKSLVYFYEVKHNSIEGSNGGIGIVEYTYEPAKQYYYAIFLAQNQTENKTLVQKVREYIIRPFKAMGTKNRTLEWGEEDIDEK